MKFGFRSDEEYDEESTPIGVGHASTLDGSDDDDSSDGWSFEKHVYLAVQIGPFAFVLGRPE